ncbi:uncharacterized protein [Periplaneta americana]
MEIMPYTQVVGGKLPGKQVPNQNVTQTLTEEQEIQIFCKQMLINRLFLGHYQERRFVEPLGSYRDVVVLSTPEYDLKKDLDVVRRRLKNFKKFSEKWIGITGPDFVGAPAGHALWVKLHNLPFGHYWFQIKQVKFVEDIEMIVRLKCVRAVDAGSVNETKMSSEKIRGSTQESDELVSSSNDDDITWERLKKSWKKNTEEMGIALSSILTVHNMKEVICFTSVFIVACVTGLFHSVRYIGDYSIRFMRESSIFIQASTPIFIAVIDFFSKCVGGLYLLIAMLWRGTPIQPRPMMDTKQRALPMPPNMHYRPPNMPYRHR